jgi:tetratricopeptide (TPR) repeat protein
MKKNSRKIVLAIVFLSGITVSFAGTNERGIDLYRAELYNAAKIFFLSQTNQTTAGQAENYYYLGQSYYRLQQKDSASFYYNKAVETDPLYPFGYIGQGKIELEKGKVKEAGVFFKKAEGLAKKDASVQTTIAEVYMAAKILPQVTDALGKAMKIDRKYPGIYAVQGDMQMQEGKTGVACASYETAISFDRTFKVAYLKLARVYQDTNPNEALRFLNELIAIDPEYIPAFAVLGDIHRANGNYPQAIDAYKKFIAIPGVPLLQHERYAQLLYFTDKNAESLAQIAFVLQEQPNNPVMCRLEAYNNFKLEKHALALEQLTKFLQNVPEKDHIYLDYLTFGRVLMKEKQYDKAIAAFIKASEFKDAKAEVYKELGSAYELAADYPLAVKAYEKFFEVETTPTVFDFFYYGQETYYAATKYTAPEYLTATRSPEQQATDDADLKAYVDKGGAAFSEVVSRSPDSYWGYLWKARIYSFLDASEQARTGKTNGIAKPYYEEALGIMLAKNEEGARNNEIVEACFYLGSYYYLVFNGKSDGKEKNDKNDALKAGEYYKKILEIEPGNPKAKVVLDALKIK